MRATSGPQFLAVVATVGLCLTGCADSGADDTDDAPAAPTPTQAQQELEEIPATGSALTVTVEGVDGLAGVDLAGVVAQEPAGLVVGGFVTEVDAGNSTTQVVYRPAEQDQPIGPGHTSPISRLYLSPAAMS